jgi:uncharacterized RDD family membrane protein YckC
VIFFVIFAIIGAVAGGFKTTHTINSAGQSVPHFHIAFLLELLEGLCVIAYGTILCGGTKGQTLGMMVAKTRVVNASDGTTGIGYGKALGRALLEYVFALILLIPWVIDMLWPLWDRMNQTLHDKAVSAVVVKV